MGTLRIALSIAMLTSITITKLFLFLSETPNMITLTLVLVGWALLAAIMGVAFCWTDAIGADMLYPVPSITTTRKITGYFILGILWPFVIFSLLREAFTVNTTRSKLKKLRADLTSHEHHFGPSL